VVDRGANRWALWKYHLREDSPVRFIIRRRGDRHLLYARELRETPKLAGVGFEGK
jgi:hypothetical protein